MRMTYLRAGFSGTLLLFSRGKAVQTFSQTGSFVTARRTVAGNSVQGHYVMSAFHAELARTLSLG